MRTYVQRKADVDLKLDVSKIIMDRKNNQHPQSKHKYKEHKPIVSNTPQGTPREQRGAKNGQKLVYT